MNWLPFEATLMVIDFHFNHIAIKLINILHRWTIFFHRHGFDRLNFSIFRVIFALRKSVAYRFIRDNIVVCLVLLIRNVRVHGWRARADINWYIFCTITQNVIIVEQFVARAVRGGIVQGVSIVVSVVVHTFNCAFLCSFRGLENIFYSCNYLRLY